MADSIRLREIQSASLEYERKQHLASWLIKSSPHMAKPISTTHPTKHTKNPIFIWGQTGHMSLNISKTPMFTSQTNLPLQIITTQEGHKPKLRRFNSHDTSANMFSVADFENARLAAKRNEIESVGLLKPQRQWSKQQSPNKSNSLGGGGGAGGDCSTENSENSKFSSDSSRELIQIDTFLRRYMLPKVVRLIIPNNEDATNTIMTDDFPSGTNSSSGEKSQSFNSRTALESIKATTADYHHQVDSNDNKGELLLLYRHLKNRKLFHCYHSKNMDRKKGIVIPQEFTGYFSLINDKGNATAATYTTIIQLVRERVYKFLSIENLIAYSESSNTDINTKTQYVKTTAKAGQVFRLLAVFEDGRNNQSKMGGSMTDFTNTSGRDKIRGRYAQLLCENRQMVYVPLSAKGKFFEVELSSQQRTQQKTINPDCVYRIDEIAKNSELPLSMKCISGYGGNVPELITLHRISTEDAIIVCPMEEKENRTTLMLKKINILPIMKLKRCLLGFEGEKKLFASPNLQNILKYCKFNCDTFVQNVEIEYLVNDTMGKRKSKTDGFKLLRPLSLSKLLNREKSYIAHEKEDSIIFLTKTELEKLESKQQQQAQNTATTQNITEKMKVFEPAKRRWFIDRRKKNKANSFNTFDVSAESKRKSMDRYHDMSKLLLERFGNVSEIEALQQANETRSYSDIGYENERAPKMDKTMSLENVRFRGNTTMSFETPDLVKVDCGNSQNLQTNIECHENDIRSSHGDDALNNPQHSFISQKLYSEFHVKTKQHSKSSSSLHQIFQLALPQKSSNDANKKKSATERNQLKFLEEATTSAIKSNVSISDEMPYSSVQDSLLYRDDPYDDTKVATENIYAEICVQDIVFEDDDNENHLNESRGGDSNNVTIINTERH